MSENKEKLLELIKEQGEKVRLLKSQKESKEKVSNYFITFHA